MRRFMVLVTVSVLLAAMLVAFAGPASAQGGVRPSAKALLMTPKSSNLSARILLAVRPR
jgi:hypothetical protein